MYAEAERRIFPFTFDGEQRHVDPLELNRRIIHAMEGDPNGVVAKCNLEANPEPVAFDAMEKFVKGVRWAFRLPDYDPATGKGALEADCLRVWDEFQSWLKKKETTPDPSLMLPAASP